jgi:hypothetical protein
LKYLENILTVFVSCCTHGCGCLRWRKMFRALVGCGPFFFGDWFISYGEEVKISALSLICDYLLFSCTCFGIGFMSGFWIRKYWLVEILSVDMRIRLFYGLLKLYPKSFLK